MSIEHLEKATELLERQPQSDVPQTITLDKTNKVSFPGFPYKFEALHEKILVSIDIFKSGYECKACKGTKKILYECSCIKKWRPGYRYSAEEIKALRTTLGDEVAEARSNMVCPECSGNPDAQRREETCEACKGLGALLVLPQTSQNLPTTGVVVSMGREAIQKASFTIGDRVLFSPHAGTMIPTKAGLMFKYMDWYQVGIKVEGAEELGAFDFIIQAD